MSKTTRTKPQRPGGHELPSLLLPVGLLLTTLLLLAATVPYLMQDPLQQAFNGVGGPFRLVTSGGRTETDKSWPGKFLLIYFGYTTCPTVCPTTMSTLAQALDRLGRKADALQPLFITVDPERDTPSAISDYAHAFSPRFIGLSGTPQQIKEAAEKFHIYYARHPEGTNPKDYFMDHSSIIYLMRPNGRLDRVIDVKASSAAMADEIAAALNAPRAGA